MHTDDDKYRRRFKKLVMVSEEDIAFINLKINSVNQKLNEIEFRLSNISEIIDKEEKNKGRWMMIYNDLLKVSTNFYTNLTNLLQLKEKYREKDLDTINREFMLLEVEIAKMNKSVENMDLITEITEYAKKNKNISLDDKKYEI